MLITPIPCLTDNYSYIIFDNNSKTTGVVDPSEAKPIISFLEKEKLNLNYKKKIILIDNVENLNINSLLSSNGLVNKICIIFYKIL